MTNLAELIHTAANGLRLISVRTDADRERSIVPVDARAQRVVGRREDVDDLTVRRAMRAFGRAVVEAQRMVAVVARAEGVERRFGSARVDELEAGSLAQAAAWVLDAADARDVGAFLRSRARSYVRAAMTDQHDRVRPADVGVDDTIELPGGRPVDAHLVEEAEADERERYVGYLVARLVPELEVRLAEASGTRVAERRLRLLRMLPLGGKAPQEEAARAIGVSRPTITADLLAIAELAREIVGSAVA